MGSECRYKADVPSWLIGVLCNTKNKKGVKSCTVLTSQEDKMCRAYRYYYKIVLSLKLTCLVLQNTKASPKFWWAVFSLRCVRSSWNLKLESGSDVKAYSYERFLMKWWAYLCNGMFFELFKRNFCEEERGIPSMCLALHILLKCLMKSN